MLFTNLLIPISWKFKQYLWIFTNRIWPHQWVSGRVGGWVSEWLGGWVGGWVSDWLLDTDWLAETDWPIRFFFFLKLLKLIISNYIPMFGIYISAQLELTATFQTPWGLWWNAVTIITHNNSLSPVRQQAITWTNVGVLSFGFVSKIWFKIHFSHNDMYLELTSIKWHQSCSNINV